MCEFDLVGRGALERCLGPHEVLAKDAVINWKCNECLLLINEGHVKGQWVKSAAGSKFVFLHPECLELRENQYVEFHPEPSLEGLPIELVVATLDAERQRCWEQQWLEMEWRRYEEEGNF